MATQTAQTALASQFFAFIFRIFLHVKVSSQVLEEVLFVFCLDDLLFEYADRGLWRPVSHAFINVTHNVLLLLHLFNVTLLPLFNEFQLSFLGRGEALILSHCLDFSQTCVVPLHEPLVVSMLLQQFLVGFQFVPGSHLDSLHDLD